MRLAALLLIVCSSAVYANWDISGNIDVQARYFFDDALDPQQKNQFLSISSEVEFYKALEGEAAITLTPFFRIDQHDPERNQIDFRELKLFWLKDNWELTFGLAKVFWGRAESLHLVDIINQTDLAGSFDGEEKLGQPMLHIANVSDYGVFDFFVLPGFRERQFPGAHGRLRVGLVDHSEPVYESSRESRRVDAAIRWSHTVDQWDWGLSHFSGTSREPRFIPGSRGLLPVYDVIDQTSIDVQLTTERWLWKLEALTRSGQGSRFSAAVTGLEYTVVGFAGSSGDLGIVAEYLYDDRGQETAFGNDVFLGLRWTANDIKSTEALFGVIIDSDTGTHVLALEASRRLGDNYLLEVEARTFGHLSEQDMLYSLRQDDYLEVRLAYYF